MVYLYMCVYVYTIYQYTLYAYIGSKAAVARAAPRTVSGVAIDGAEEGSGVFN